MKTILKKTTVLSILSVLLITLIIPVFAHPGSLDENGGHYDRKTGEYHYHHGYSAHQHTNGECPYDFHDNVNNKSKSDYTKKTENQISKIFEEEKKIDLCNILYRIFLFLFIIAFILLILTFFIAVYQDFKNKKLKIFRSILFTYIVIYCLALMLISLLR